MFNALGTIVLVVAFFTILVGLGCLMTNGKIRDLFERVLTISACSTFIVTIVFLVWCFVLLLMGESPLNNGAI